MLHAGFNISLEPGFSAARLSFILAYNGIYAVANLRCFWVPVHVCNVYPEGPSQNYPLKKLKAAQHHAALVHFLLGQCVGVKLC